MTIRAVHHINCATMCPIAGRFLGQPDAGFGRGRMVAHCLLVETERDGLVLVDTGFGTRDLEGHTITGPFVGIVGPKLSAAECAINQLPALGYTVDDVKHIVVTHLDLDHAGGISDFPRAKVHLHAREHAAAMQRPSLKERERYKTAHWAHGPSWEVYTEDGDTWRGLPAITKLRGVDADIGLVPMHGHTRGHSAVIVKAPSNRWLVHAGDAYFHHTSVAGGSVPLGFQLFERAMQIDGAKRRASLAALRQLRSSYPDIDMFSAHDPAELDAFRN